MATSILRMCLPLEDVPGVRRIPWPDHRPSRLVQQKNQCDIHRGPIHSRMSMQDFARVHLKSEFSAAVTFGNCSKQVEHLNSALKDCGGMWAGESYHPEHVW